MRSSVRKRSGGEDLPPDTIVALATPPGLGAIAVIRMSGPEAGGILRRLAPGVGEWEDRRVRLATLRDPRADQVIDRALVTVFSGPGSYTGEDVVEISVHGGRLPSQRTLAACQELGAREAAPGEFTRRAYLNGKMDLVQAEGVADLVAATSRGAHEVAIGQIAGALSRRIERLRERLLRVEVLLAHHLDFPEEDEPPTPISELVREGKGVLEELRQMLGLAPEGLLLREGAVVVLAGRPNAGKSSLFNALLGEDRAIVTPEAGTTRDAVEGHLEIGGFPFRLIDTAGLREAEGIVERKGIEIAERYLGQAQLVLFCHPADEEWSEDEWRIVEQIPEERVVWVETCADRQARVGGGRGSPFRGSGLAVSAETGEGIGVLREELKRRVFSGLLEQHEEPGVLTRPRQRQKVEEAGSELAAFIDALEGGVPADLAAVNLRSAREELEGLLGTADPEEVLDELFRSFCIGK